MPKSKRFLWGMLSLALLLMGIVLGFFLTRPKIMLTYKRSGGIAGITQSLEIMDDSSFTFVQSTGTERQGHLDPKLLAAIRELGGELRSMTIGPKPGAVDFFNYDLTYTSGLEKVTVKWVDDFAASEEIPLELRDTVSAIKAVLSQLLDEHYDNSVSASSNNTYMEAKLDKFYYSKNENAFLYIRVRNQGNDTLEYTSPTPCDPDFDVTLLESSEGYEVNFTRPPFSKGTICVQVLQIRRILPNEETVNDAIVSFSDSLVSGVYHVHIKFPLGESTWSPLELEIPFYLLDS